MHKSAISSSNTRTLKTTDCLDCFSQDFTRLKFFKILIGDTLHADLIGYQLTLQQYSYAKALVIDKKA